MHKGMADERERGRELAKILADDKNFIREIKNVKGKKLSQLITYLGKRNLFSKENPLTPLSLCMCAYTLEKQYGIDLGYKDEWKLVPDEEFSLRARKEGYNATSEIIPGSKLKKK